jgi:hypothetical protein
MTGAATPWDFSGIFIVGMIALDLFIVGLVWLWAWSGRAKREKKIPFKNTAENYAGQVQTASGPIPAFLIVIYIVVLSFIVIYIVNTFVTGVRY